MDLGPVLFTVTIAKMVIEFTIATLPIALITRMKMRTGQKIGIVLLLAVGYSVTITSAIKVYYIYIGFVNNPTYDTWQANKTFLAGGIEAHVSVVRIDTIRIFELISNQFRSVPACLLPG
jgi:rhodopsin domain-containing protein